MDERRAWLTGNHVFLTPECTDDRVRELRQRRPVSLRFELPAGLPLHGPPASVSFENLHALLALQFGFGDFEVLEVDGPGWPARLILDPAGEFSPAERDVLAGALRTMGTAAAELFGGVPFPTVGLLVFRDEGMGGLEGAWACQAYLPASVDLADARDPARATFLLVACHELVHTWLPIGLFALDDPWLKEGVTSHYGQVLAARAGWLDAAAIARTFAAYPQVLAGEPGLEAVALSDPRLWYEEYSGESWRRVTYDRGHAVALMLDVYLREQTGNLHSLDDVLRTLFARHLHGAFDRAQLLAAIEEASGVDAAGFFARRVDATAAPAAAEVERALERAVELGVFAVEAGGR